MKVEQGIEEIDGDGNNKIKYINILYINMPGGS